MPRPLSADHAALGQAVIRRREEFGLSQEELGHLAGLHRNYVGGIERGERNLAYANLIKLSVALGLRASQLIEQAEAIRAGH